MRMANLRSARNADQQKTQHPDQAQPRRPLRTPSGLKFVPHRHLTITTCLAQLSTYPVKNISGGPKFARKHVQTGAASKLISQRYRYDEPDTNKVCRRGVNPCRTVFC